MQFEWELALPVSILLLYFLWTVWRYFRRIVKRFQLQPTSVVSGAFNNEAAAQGVPDAADQIAREQQACSAACSTRVLPMPRVYYTHSSRRAHVMMACRAAGARGAAQAPAAVRQPARVGEGVDGHHRRPRALLLLCRWRHALTSFVFC